MRVDTGTAVMTSADAPSIPWRWLALGIFFLASALNYLDRQLLAALAPAIKADFNLSNAEYGWLLSAFSLAYMVMTPLAGLFIDKVGLNAGLTIAVLFWSLASATTAFARSLRDLIASRIALGLGEAAGIPGASKAVATYLPPPEWSLGQAVGSVGITLGSIGAPLIVAALTPRYDWRAVFIFCGALGVLWVPLWLLTAWRIPAHTTTKTLPRTPVTSVLYDWRLWVIVIANALVMTLYSLWTNWTTIYLVQERGLTQLQANQYFAWIPPIFATLGGFAGAALTFRWIRRGSGTVSARVRVCQTMAPILLITAAIPFVPSTPLAVAAICLSFFACMAVLINVPVILIDLFGVGRAAFTSSLLTCSFSMMQMFVSPIIGTMVDRYGFVMICMAFSILPLLGVVLLRTLSSSARVV